MIVDLPLFAFSLVLLIYSSDGLVSHVVLLARRFNVSVMVLGLTVVAVGTSLPEAAASAVASFEGHPAIALGNVLGSNICNVGLVLGLSALLSPVVAKRGLIRQESLLMLGVVALLWLLGLLLGGIALIVGLVFLFGFAGFIYLVIVKDKAMLREAVNEALESSEQPIDAGLPNAEEVKDSSCSCGLSNVLKVLLYLALVCVSSELLVQSTVGLALEMGVSEAVIALSLIALGTSLPELSVSIASAKRNEGDILVGNIIGSNISNVLLVLGVAACIHPMEISGYALWLDLPAVLIFLLAMTWCLYRPEGITRARGVVFLGAYVLYVLRCVFIPA